MTSGLELGSPLDLRDKQGCKTIQASEKSEVRRFEEAGMKEAVLVGPPVAAHEYNKVVMQSIKGQRSYDQVMKL